MRRTKYLLLLKKSGLQELRVSGLALSAGKTQIVTYGDLWRDAVIEEGGGEKGTDDDNYQTSVGTELSMMATEAMKPIKAAATGVASAVWSKLSPSPDDEEIQRNLKAFASQHSGAVMTPLGDDELANEVRYLGMFPDLVDALLEAEEDKVESEEEAAAAAAAVAAAAISAEASTDQDETVQQPPTIAPAPPPLAM